MQVPVQITFRDTPHSEAVKEHIQEKVDKLQQFCHNIVACHVVVEFENKNQRRGNLHNTRITVTVPGKELVTTHNETEDMYASIDMLIDKLDRQLIKYKEKRRNHRDSEFPEQNIEE